MADSSLALGLAVNRVTEALHAFQPEEQERVILASAGLLGLSLLRKIEVPAPAPFACGYSSAPDQMPKSDVDEPPIALRLKKKKRLSSRPKSKSRGTKSVSVSRKSSPSKASKREQKRWKKGFSESTNPPHKTAPPLSALGPKNGPMSKVVEVLRKAPNGLDSHAIAQAAGLPRDSVFTILYRMKTTSRVSHDKATKLYKLLS